jgi:PIN domain nuclease of toxin-antitoxin system
MRVLLDTGVWFRRYHRLPQTASLSRFLDREVTEYHLCPLSVAGVTFKWQRGRLPGVRDPRTWVDHALENFVLESLSAHPARQAGLWDWDHGDLVDRALAAIASETGVVLVDTDRVLKGLGGFPQRYFANRSMGGQAGRRDA